MKKTLSNHQLGFRELVINKLRKHGEVIFSYNKAKKISIAALRLFFLTQLKGKRTSHRCRVLFANSLNWILWLGCNILFLFQLSCSTERDDLAKPEITSTTNITAINQDVISTGTDTLAIVHCQIIIGDGQSVIPDGVVIIANEMIQTVGAYETVALPDGIPIFEAKGMTLVPGLIDAHFHLDNMDSLPNLFLQRGITALRDPGAWIEAYDQERASGLDLPRLYLTGPHIDGYPPAYPNNSFVVRDPLEASAAVKSFGEQGASAIKVYFRSSLAIIEAVCEAADEEGIPVTAHLEITDIYDAVNAGLTGIEHITSLAPNLVSAMDAEAYKQAILKDNNARRTGRYNLWQKIDPLGLEATQLAQFLAEQKTFICPTLGAFEYQVKDGKVDSLRQQAFQNMTAYTKAIHKLGVAVVVGSHSWVPYADYGWAYHNEMELFEKLGMERLAIIQSATSQNASFLGIADRIGTIASGKIADLVLIAGNPLNGISEMRKINKVMLAGKWITTDN